MKQQSESTSPFEYVKAINRGDRTYARKHGLSGYSPFLTGRAFSFFPDTVAVTNIANQASFLMENPDMHWAFMSRAIRARDRFAGSWPKAKVPEKVQTLSEIYNVSIEKAAEYAKLIKGRVEKPQTGGIEK